MVISKKIVETYNGSIGFKSKWGAGSTFAFKIAIMPSDGLAVQIRQVTESKISGENTLTDLDNLEMDLDDLVYGGGNDDISMNVVLPDNIMSHLPAITNMK